MPTIYWDKLETKKPTVESGFLKWCLQEVFGFTSFYVFFHKNMKINSIMTKS